MIHAAIAYASLAFTQYAFIAFLLLRFNKAKQNFPTELETRRAQGAAHPPISILVPVKGVLAEFGKNFRSILAQDYPGTLEIIFGVKDPQDGALVEARRILSQSTTSVEVKFAVGEEDQGLNPKNSNLARAFALSTHSWIYCSDADVWLPPDHLRRCMAAVNSDPTQFATAMTVNYGPQSLGAKLECAGANLEATMYFMSAMLKNPNDSMNGAAMFFHRELLAKSGGFAVSLNKLTDDLVLGREFTLHGGSAQLVPGLVREKLTHQSLAAFHSRMLRWIMIAAAFRPELFWVGPIFWIWQWFIIFGLLSQSSLLLLFGIGTFTFRLLTSILTQFVLEAPAADLRHLWVLPIYDIVGPLAWMQSLFQKEIIWAGNRLTLKQHGLLVKK